MKIVRVGAVFVALVSALVMASSAGGANECDALRNQGSDGGFGSDRKSLRIANVCEAVPDDATGRGGIRTHTPVAREGILSPQCLPFHHAARETHFASARTSS